MSEFYYAIKQNNIADLYIYFNLAIDIYRVLQNTNTTNENCRIHSDIKMDIQIIKAYKY